MNGHQRRAIALFQVRTVCAEYSGVIKTQIIRGHKRRVKRFIYGRVKFAGELHPATKIGGLF